MRAGSLLDKRLKLLSVLVFTLVLGTIPSTIALSSNPSNVVSAPRSASLIRSYQDGVAPTSSYSGTRDAYLSENNPTSNYGSATTLLLDGDDPNGTGRDKSALLKWDISDIPAGSVVQDVTLTLYVTDQSAAQAYEIYGLKRNWVESQVTWQQFASALNWEFGGATGSLDRNEIPLGSISAVDFGTLQTYQLNASGIAQVQAWVNSPAANFGLIIADSSNSNGLDFAASEHSTVGQRPKLTITYTTGGPTATPTPSSTSVIRSYQDGAAPMSSYSGTRDAYLSENNPTSNYGSATTLLLDGDDPNGTGRDKSALLKWDISDIPAGSVVQDVTLTLYVTDQSAAQAYEIYGLKRNWVESQVTWQQFASALNWELGGANGGGDRGTTVLGSISAVDIGLFQTYQLNASGIAQVQAWVNSPAANFGLIIADSSNSDGLDFAASEHSTVGQRPKLTITYTTGGTTTPTPTPTPPTGPIRFAVIGDYSAGQAALDVSNLVKSWNPAFIITTGDNNYPDGTAETIDRNIGQYYHSFIYPYTGSYGSGATTNRFFPSLGNHDWVTSGATPYLNYFTLPGNERYYDFVWGPVHFFAIDSDPHEPDGISSTSNQAIWLRNKLATSTAPFQMVYFHHPPYSSGQHGSTFWMQWPFKEWGIDAVLSGHDHTYERIIRDNLPYLVVGLGGRSIYSFSTPITGSQVRYNADYGAMLVEANATQATFKFFNRQSQQIDSYTIMVP